jgi:hypothetical protein
MIEYDQKMLNKWEQGLSNDLLSSDCPIHYEHMDPNEIDFDELAVPYHEGKDSCPRHSRYEHSGVALHILARYFVRRDLGPVFELLSDEGRGRRLDLVHKNHRVSREAISDEATAIDEYVSTKGRLWTTPEQISIVRKSAISAQSQRTKNSIWDADYIEKSLREINDDLRRYPRIPEQLELL